MTGEKVLKETLLVIDHIEVDRIILRERLKKDFQIFEASNAQDALKIFEEQHISAVFLELNLPEVSGINLLEAFNNTKESYRPPVIAFSNENNSDLLEEAVSKGAADVCSKPFPEATILLKRLNNLITLYKSSSELSSMDSNEENKEFIILSKKNAELLKENEELSVKKQTTEKLFYRIFEQISNLVEFRNEESGLHIKRLCGYTKIILTRLGETFSEYSLTDDQLNKIVFATVFHDVGKIAIPDTILCKPGPLTNEERLEMQQHTTLGAQIVQNMGDIMDEESFSYAKDICSYHHERYDGYGYPSGLSGEEIPFWAQVVGICDVYEALTSERVYKAAFPHDTAINMILNGECGSFNPKLLEVLQNCEKELFVCYKETK